ncbi:hypothetical protein GCM10029963_11770 [Micromonospora andamanensis]
MGCHRDPPTGVRRTPPGRADGEQRYADPGAHPPPGRQLRGVADQQPRVAGQVDGLWSDRHAYRYGYRTGGEGAVVDPGKSTTFGASRATASPSRTPAARSPAP